MESSSVTGLAKSWGDIIELAVKCLDCLTLKVALAQIEQWMSMDTLNVQHYQMIMDVDATLASCHLLLGLMDERISKLGLDSKNVLKSVSKAKVVMAEKATLDCIIHLSH
ncbi:Target of rapamycin complex subunit [Venturia nashicola]|nr:Target of rapamycin complex subunit [Venturia nashicola]